MKKLAKFFDVGLIVRFAPYSEIADWTNSLTERSFDIPDFSHDSFEGLSFKNNTGVVERKEPQSESIITRFNFNAALWASNFTSPKTGLFLVGRKSGEQMPEEAQKPIKYPIDMSHTIHPATDTTSIPIGRAYA